MKKEKPEKKDYPKRHVYKIDEEVIFSFLGEKMLGNIVAHKFVDVDRAIYTICNLQNNIMHPHCGVDGSGAFCNIWSEETKEFKNKENAIINIVPPTEEET